jgi:type I restriction enzyme S subunit
MSRYEVLVPGNADLGRLESEMMPVLRRGHRALSENEALTELRDALLPELLSGRLRVREVEEMVGSV